MLHERRSSYRSAEILAACTCLALLLCMALGVQVAQAVPGEAAAGEPSAYAAARLSAESGGETALECAALSGRNTGYQNYSYWSSQVYSYLTSADGGYLRVQGNVSGQGVVAVYYDSDFNLLSRKTIPAELPLFGGFYETADNYYLVTGQNNTAEDDSAEVFRITKYDKSWNRLGSCGLYGANTVHPFDAGSCRMDNSGKYLVIRTCHEMYTTSDGLNHQANVTILVDTDAMEVTDSFTGIMNSSYGYVSHSFNQFVKVLDNKIVAVDHGDAYPRSICLMRYPTDITTGSFRSYNVTTTSLLGIAGDIGNNATGASVGGFEISATSYLVAGNSVVQDDQSASRRTRNVFVAAQDRSTNQVQLRWLTDYAEGETGASTPHLVEVGDNRYMVLWTREGSVNYVFVDGDGQKTSSVYSMAGELSDCVPAVIDGAVTWYTWENGSEAFYRIPVGAPDDATVVNQTYDHDYQWLKTEDGIATKVCSKCGDVVTGKVPTSFATYWKDASASGYYWSYTPRGLEANGSAAWFITDIGYSAESDVTFGGFTVEAQDPQNCIVGQDSWTITFKTAGVFTVTIYPTYNPEVKKNYTFTIVKPLESVSLEASAPSPQAFGSSVRLTATADGGKGSLSYRFYVEGPDGQEVLVNSGGALNYVAWTPQAAGSYRIRAEVTDAGDDNRLVASEELAYVVSPAAVEVKGGKSVEAAGGLTYGQKLSELAVANASFVVAGTSKPVEGVFAFDDPDGVPNAGAQSASWTFTPSDSNYAGTSGTLAFTVEKATPQIIKAPAVGASAYHPSKSLADRALVGGEASVEGSWQWDRPDTVPAVPGGTFSSTFVPADTENYKTVSCQVNVVVSRAVPVVTSVQAQDIVYGSALAASALAGSAQYSADDATAVPGTFAWDDATVSPAVKDSGATAYAFTFTPDDAENYAAATGFATVRVQKAEHPAITPSATYNVAFSVEALSDDILAGAEGWKFSPAQIGTALVAGETQTFTALYCGNDAGNYEIESVDVKVTRSTCDHARTEARGAKDATCTEEGRTGDVYCSVCGELLESGRTIDKLAHAYEWVTVTGSTCAHEGLERQRCAVCGEFLEGSDRAIPQLAHAYEWVTVIGPTCVDEGLERQRCTVCGDEDGGLSRIVQKLGHAWSDWTAGADGRETRTCERCGETEEREPAPQPVKSFTAEVTGGPFTFTGKAIKPDVTVKDGEQKLALGVDYSVRYKSNVNAGTATAVITGEGAYAGCSKSVTFVIARAQITSATLSKAELAYTGKAQKPTVKSVKAGKLVLAKSDYSLSYANAKSKVVGSYKVTVTGKGNYTGKKVLTYKIAQAANSAKAAKTSVAKSYTVKSLAKKAATITLPKVTTKFGTAKWTVTGKDKNKVLSLSGSSVKVKKGAKKGTYTIKLRADVTATKNYKKASTKVVIVKVTVK